MKKYRIWTHCCTIDIFAKTLEVVSIGDRPLKIRLSDENDCLLAEFYCNTIEGWAIVDCLEKD
jgi:hypothetical protein